MTDLMNLSQALLVPCKILDKGILSILLSRDKTTQIQLFVVPSFTTIPDHKHPNVKVLIKVISGRVQLRKGTKRVLDNGGGDRVYTIEPGELHGFKTLDEPVVFLVEEYWQNGVKPTSVEQDWEGESLGPLQHHHD